MFYPCYYPETAEKYLKVFNELQITDLLGTPKIKDLPHAWYSDFVKSFFGAVDLDNRARLIQEFFVLIPKKNAKSTISGLIMLTALIANPYQGAEFALIAASREVVNNAFIPIVECIKANQTLSVLFKIYDNGDSKYIKHAKTNAVLRITTPLMKTNQGKKWHGVLIDEVALWQDVKNATSILNEITGNLINKKDAFIIYLTTQSHEAPHGVFKALLNKARAISQKGEPEILKTKFLPILYEFSQKEIENGEHKKPENWHKVNPNLGRSVDFERLKQMQIDAEQAGSDALREFEAKYLNVEITMNTSSIDGWQGAEFWTQCEKRITLNQVMDKSDHLFIGIDGGGLDDLTGVAVLGIDGKGLWRIWAFGYGYKSVMERAGLAKRLAEFQAANECLIVDRLGDDAIEIGKLIKKIYDTGKLKRIGIDPRGIGDILTEIKSHGTPESIIEQVNQGVALMGAEKTFSRRLAQRAVVICQSDLMRFCVGNAIVEQRGDDYFLSKKSSLFKIDPLIAILDAIALYERHGVSEVVVDTTLKYQNAVSFINAMNKRKAIK